MADASTERFLQPVTGQDVAKTQIGPGKKRCWQSDKVEKQPDAKLCLKADRSSLSCLVVVREVLPTIAIILAIFFGASWRTFNFSDTSIFGFGINVDVQLALVGFLNKVLDVFVQASLKHTASIFLTVWMALGSRFSGVNMIDFQLKEELTQPWTCILNFWTRCSVLGWKGLGYWGVFRFIACLGVSTCVLLLALAVNTVGIPKARWYPNGAGGGWRLTDDVRKSMTITSPCMMLNGLDWMNYWNTGQNLVGSGGSAWDAALALAAASTLPLLGGLPHLYTSSPNGWLPIPSEVDGLITGINTVINGSTVQSISVQKSRVRDIFTNLRANGPESYYKHSSGWSGLINITVPILTTSCVSGLAMNGSIPIGTIPVNGPSDSSPTESKFIVPIGEIPFLNFTGATCAVVLNQALFPVGTWIVNMGDIDVSINNYGKNMNSTPVLLAPSIGDRASAQSLAIQLGSTVGRINGLLQTGLVYHMVLISRRLSFLNPDILAVNDIAGITIAMATITQHLLTTGAWNMTVSSDPNCNTTSFPVKWQVYGSGPRLAWEWVSVIVLAVVLTALVGGGIFTLTSQIEPGPWLDVGGMMLAANEAAKMKSVIGSIAGVASQKAKEAKYYVRDIRQGVVELVDETKDNRELKKNKSYVNEGYTVIASRPIDWEALQRTTKAFFNLSILKQILGRRR
ncbi:uncharacterized protein BP5553_05812 [Venustampulla echinocandica]|uniref:Uncharacterized protein n=1 Tax=Venustampulla echinocandica TaxID=2656787 RepID=A0A370TLQ8_9HELO|nr:uncharacterized protein BP5553_05812 [Venustampulla echinocandica]RDL36460.1 hypothetical protein BP5553_05812 [Venustampulla echinocandica]